MSELADRIVALGVGRKGGKTDSYGDKVVWYCLPDEKLNPIWAHQFTHSWGVAGAMMEKCLDAGLSHKGLRVPLERDRFPYEFEWKKYNAILSDWISISIAQSDSLPYAIIVASDDALEILGQETGISQSIEGS